MAVNSSDIFKTKRQKKEYNRMVNQLYFIESWINKHNHILKKNCNDDNIHYFQLYRNYQKKKINIKKQLNFT